MMDIIKDLENLIGKCRTLQHNSWHDLRKNPKDLPKDRDWVLAVFKESDSDFILVPRVADYVGKQTPITTKENWLIIDIEEMDDYFYNLECIGWKYIDEFDIGGKSITKPSVEEDYS